MSTPRKSYTRVPKLNGEPGRWRINHAGYRIRSMPGSTTQLEHRWMMETHLGRPLHRHEYVHHLNGDRTDNRIENLELWSSWQPPGQRVVDKLAWAREVLASYPQGVDNL